MKKERGYSEEYVVDVNEIDVSTVAWKDNKLLTWFPSLLDKNLELMFRDGTNRTQVMGK